MARHHRTQRPTRAEAYGFVQWLGDNYKPGGVAIRVRSLRAYYGWLVNEELIDKNPFKGITISVPAEAKLTPSDDDIDAMLAKAKGHRRDHALFTLLVDSGARKGEVAALTVKDVDLASGMVTFRVSKTVARTVPLTDRASSLSASGCANAATAAGRCGVLPIRTRWFGRCSIATPT